MADSLSFSARLVLAFVCFFRVLFDGELAARVSRALSALPALPPSSSDESAEHEHGSDADAPESAKQPERADLTSALQLIGLLQREGRLVDFLEQDITSFSDADIGAAARVVHEGCRKALRSHAQIVPIRAEDEGASVTLEAGFSASEIKLTGNVAGSPPHRGVLRHRGWRVSRFELPKSVEGHDHQIVAAAEVEL